VKGREVRIPAAILMSGTGSNARKILEYSPAGSRAPRYEIRVILSDNPDSNYRRIAEEHGVAARLNDIYEFYGVPRPGQGLSLEERRKLRDPDQRERFDLRSERLLAEFGVRLVALAGYDWIVSSFLCRAYVVVNVHPGDLRVRDSSGRRRYIGLGWVPTAKAILNGERFVHSTTHLVTPELDGGPIARVSRPVAVSLPPGLRGESLFPEGMDPREVLRQAVRQADEGSSADTLAARARKIQKRLKESGDWVEFPKTLDLVAALMQSGRLARDRAGGFLLDGAAPPDLFLQDAEE
jgi:folate-dependent phosphoribosylglycinamide formyltransferase PurN